MSKQDLIKAKELEIRKADNLLQQLMDASPVLVSRVVPTLKRVAKVGAENPGIEHVDAFNDNFDAIHAAEARSAQLMREYQEMLHK
jgi:hypothetical protein